MLVNCFLNATCGHPNVAHAPCATGHHLIASYLSEYLIKAFTMAMYYKYLELSVCEICL